MADPTEPVPDRPPADPIDVAVSPDAPPMRPLDVPVSPDGPPAAPVDVTVSPDGPPWTPIDVAVSPDAAPARPFDVQTSPDAPPRAPVDVTTTPDHAPAAPIDVAVSPDAPAAGPFQVNVVPDAPPAAPFQVPTSPDAPPAAPFNVAITPDAPPLPPFNVPVLPDPPALAVKAQPGRTPTIDEIVSAVIGFDRQLGTFLAGIVDIEPVHINGPGAGALDPTALARWFRDYTSSVGAAGVTRFITEQSALYGMNPRVARIFDPSYFLKMLIPGSMGNAVTTIDVETGTTMAALARAEDELLQTAVSMNPEKPAGNGFNVRPEVYGPENKYTEGQAYSVDTIVDAIIDGPTSPVVSPFMTMQGGIKRFDASSFFEPRDSAGTQQVRAIAKSLAAAGQDNVMTSKLASSNALDGVIRVGVPGEEQDGSVLHTTQDPSEVVDDDDARVPISFTDLRQVPGRRYRSVYFRPENLSFNESISPEFSEASTFGRVDAVVGYQRTQRSVSVNFDVHAFAPEDLQRMYNKMTWLKSMCYPTFGSDSLIQSGPVVRMRIGDAVGTDQGGLPGIIRNLSFDFADAMWELKRGMKVPKMYKVSLEFLVLHDGPVGIVNGVFGVYQLPPGGPPVDKNTNLAGNPTDSRTEDTQGPTVMPGMFSRFGEPRS